ncbi:hypothetical protein M8494_16125 [Serratia ureilytica]
MISLMEQLLDNDNLQLSQVNNTNANLFNINSAYYISQTSKSYYRYTYDTRMVDTDSFMFLEAIRLNNRLNMSLTELSDQIIDVNVRPLVRKDAYLKSIQLTDVLNALSTRLIFMKINYDDGQITNIVNALLTRCPLSASSRLPMGCTPLSIPISPTPPRLFRAMSTM